MSDNSLEFLKETNKRDQKIQRKIFELLDRAPAEHREAILVVMIQIEISRKCGEPGFDIDSYFEAQKDNIDGLDQFYGFGCESKYDFAAQIGCFFNRGKVKEKISALCSEIILTLTTESVKLI